MMRVTASDTTATAMNVYLVHFRLFGASFLNFIENIGISLTRRSESTAEHAGMSHVLSVNTPTMLLRSNCEIYANEPQIRAHDGGANPMKFSLWRVSILNFPKRNAENTAMIKAV